MCGGGEGVDGWMGVCVCMCECVWVVWGDQGSLMTHKLKVLVHA